MLHVPKNNYGKDAGAIWQLFYGKTHLTISTSRRWMLYANHGNVNKKLIKHLKVVATDTRYFARDFDK